MDLFDFTSFFAWTFLNFLARCEIAMNNNPNSVTLAASWNKTVNTVTEESVQKVPMIPPEATRSSPTPEDTSSPMDAFKQEKELSLNENGRIIAEKEFDTNTKNEV